MVLAVLILFWLAVNWIYQVVCKPTELFFPVSGALDKTPMETWRRYGPLFQEYSTPVMSPGLLAALAQVESAGNPIVRTYWRWSWTMQPFEWYRPASSAVGMYQMTDGTFAEARHYCIRQHAARSCPAGSLYTRVLPGDAVELTAAYLDRSVALSLARQRGGGAPLQRRRQLAAVIHLCGAAAGDEFVRRGFRLLAGQRCGDHDARAYLDQVMTLQGAFDRLERLTPH